MRSMLLQAWQTAECRRHLLLLYACAEDSPAMMCACHHHYRRLHRRCHCHLASLLDTQVFQDSTCLGDSQPDPVAVCQNFKGPLRMNLALSVDANLSHFGASQHTPKWWLPLDHCALWHDAGVDD